MKRLLLLPCLFLGCCQAIPCPGVAQSAFSRLPYLEVTLYHREW